MKRTGLSNYRQVYGLLLGSYGKDRYVRLSFLLALFSRVCKYIALPIVASLLIASLASQDYDRARSLVLIFAAFSATMGILAPTIKYVALKGENTMYTKLMQEYFMMLLSKDVKYFNESMSGYITSATRHYGDDTLGLIRKLRDTYLGTVFSMLIPIVIISFVNIQLGFLVFALGAVQAIYLLWASHKIGPYRTKARETYKQNSGLISDAITNILAIKSTAQERTFSENIGSELNKEGVIFITRYKVQAKLIMLREVITVSFFLILFWVTVSQMSTGALGIAGAVLVITYSFTIMTAIYDLSAALDEHDDFIDRIIPMFELFKDKNLINDPSKPRKLGAVKGAIQFKNIDFSYVEGNSKVPVFKNLNLKIPAGQKLGVVGLSGAGKSTLAKLLLRFEDIQNGSITVDGTSISSIKQADLRQNIAYVPQEPLLFHSSIAENIRLANLLATDEQITQAAKSAYADRFIKALPKGYDSIVGERGIKLSGGQKQRVAIARAVLQDAPIMLLDEATSALDSESEQIIKESFGTILKGKTAIVIAHRLSTLADMDRIVLLHEGAIIEDGSHKELLKKNGVYAKLWRRQRLHPEDLETEDINLDTL